MNCENMQEWLADYLGDELSAEDRRTVDEHLIGCASCRNEVQSLMSAVDSMRLLDAPNQFETRITPSGDTLIGESTQSWPKISIWGHGLAYAAVLIAGLAIGWNAKPGSGGARFETNAMDTTPLAEDDDGSQRARDLPADKIRDFESMRGAPVLRNALALSQAFTQHRSR